MATKTKVAQLDQGAVHNAAEPANNVSKAIKKTVGGKLNFRSCYFFDFHTCKKNSPIKIFTRQKFHRLNFRHSTQLAKIYPWRKFPAIRYSVESLRSKRYISELSLRVGLIHVA